MQSPQYDDPTRTYDDLVITYDGLYVHDSMHFHYRYAPTLKPKPTAPVRRGKHPFYPF